MVNTLRQVAVASSPAAVYKALTDRVPRRLTDDTTSARPEGGVVAFRSPPGGSP